MNRRPCAKWRILLVLVCCTLFLPISAAAEGFTLRHGDRETPQIAITIDDCYDRKHILAAVELCEKHGIPVTFFPIGNALKFADSALWQRALDAGCEIGNHSWGHKDLTRLSSRDIRYQMLRTQQKIDEMLGYHYPMQVMRPPFGSTSSKVAEAVASVGYLHAVKWDVSQTDAAKAIKQVQNGSILLYHGRAKDIRCLETLIPQLLEKGYECVTVSELLGLEAVETSEDIYIYQSAHAK
ncbi:MAG: polysaccharide deacetylase family protein [Clostridia bacterium]|nr:polysaccharide deacetylase family protein [Clostridia bacterium]